MLSYGSFEFIFFSSPLFLVLVVLVLLFWVMSREREI